MFAGVGNFLSIPETEKWQLGAIRVQGRSKTRLIVKEIYIALIIKLPRWILLIPKLGDPNIVVCWRRKLFIDHRCEKSDNSMPNVGAGRFLSWRWTPGIIVYLPLIQSSPGFSMVPRVALDRFGLILIDSNGHRVSEQILLQLILPCVTLWALWGGISRSALIWSVLAGFRHEFHSKWS